ncbi:TadE/TadG family type IV pilus assembly protein [Paenibacillus senegalensis]|uniref:TadE/TadG family type IV pilus assembly protein n=1 Tax=Paenibacillus senegalensis TaxID=1465766 RepID=UPI0002888F0C|nr:hypothetical protein [Paenibacillus senegalensis]
MLACKAIRKAWSREEGGVALEAALTLPFFLAFIIALNCFIQISIAETALKTAVMETTKQLAANMYPVEVIYDEIVTRSEGTAAGKQIREVIDKARKAQAEWKEIEDTIGSFAALVPQSSLQWLEWEAKFQGQKDAAEEWIHLQLYAAFKPVLLHHANTNLLDKERLEIVNMSLPSLGGEKAAFLTIEAKYTFKLPIPFFNKTLTIKKEPTREAGQAYDNYC